MSWSVDLRIADLLEAINWCRRQASVLGDANIDLVDIARDAIERNLQIIGGAAKHLSPEIAWTGIRGFRNILSTSTSASMQKVVRDVVEIHLPSLAEAVQQHRPDDSPLW